MRHHLRVMTFNIRKGLGSSGRKAKLVQIRDAIRQVAGDVVFLQEVMGHSKKDVHTQAGLKPDHLEYLADSVWPHFAYGKNSVHLAGHHGNAILSKFPFHYWDNLDISNNRFERRGLLHAAIKIPKVEQNIHLVCLHLDLLERGRKIQIGRLVGLIKALVPKGEPLLVAGDFNDWREQVTKCLQEELHLQEVGVSSQGRHIRTFPSWMPLLPLDRIYYRGMQLVELKKIEDPQWRWLSDHQALVAHFKIS